MKLPYDEFGEGPAVLLLHAGIADRTMWGEHLEPLAAAGYRVVALDLPGFGEAAVGSGPVAHWEDVLETMDDLGIERAALVGNSFGGAVALRVAAVAPERVSAMALFSAGAVPEPDPSPRPRPPPRPHAEHAPDPLEEDPGLLGGIACPVLLAAGEEDMVDFKDAVPALAARLPSVTTTLIPDCGHLAPLEVPAEFQRLVRDLVS